MLFWVDLVVYIESGLVLFVICIRHRALLRLSLGILVSIDIEMKGPKS
jgi:hypothetical protein